MSNLMISIIKRQAAVLTTVERAAMNEHQGRIVRITMRRTSVFVVEMCTRYVNGCSRHSREDNRV